MSKPKSWADGPFPLVGPSRSGDAPGTKLKPARAMAAEMSVVHNLFIRGLNAVYNQSINVATKGSEKDKLDFANFAFQIVEGIHEHHEFEETTLFPQMNEMAGVPGMMDGNVEQHAAFHDPMKLYRDYLADVKEGKQELSGEVVNRHIDAFMPPLHKHLESEVDTIVGLEKYDDKVDWVRWFNKEVEKLNKKFMATYSFRTEILPMLMVLHDGTFEGGVWKWYPPIPFLILWGMRFLYMHKMAHWWRFAPCDLYARPKELPFA